MKKFLFVLLCLLPTSLYAWEATVQVTNNTAYNIDMSGTGAGGPYTIKPGETFVWNSSDTNNAKALRFWQQPNVYFMQGNVSYGPLAGVYVDRGWMDPTAQTIKMTATALGKTFVQTQNGGETLLAWNEFEQGGKIFLTFDKQ
jgi:hypothetical protein